MISCTTNAHGEGRHEDPVIALLRDLFQLQHPPSACTTPSEPVVQVVARIDKAGWDAEHGVRVESIPTPVPGEPSRQTVRIVLPWPAPGPHAPLYVWVRGRRGDARLP